MSGFKTGLNLLGRVTGGWWGSTDAWWGPLRSKETLNKLSPAAQASLLRDVDLSMQFDPAKADALVPSADGLKNYINSSSKRLEALWKDTGLEKISTLPAESPTAQAIPDALKPTEAFTKKMKQYEEGMAAIKETIKNSRALYDPETLLTRMHKLHSLAHGAMKEQQAAEQAALKAVFDDPLHQQALQGACGLTPEQFKDKPEEVAKTQASANGKDLAKFDEGVKKPLSKMHNLSQLEVDRLFYFAVLKKYNKAMEIEIDRLHDKAMEIEIDRLHDANHQDGSPNVVVQQGRKGNRALFKGMKPSDLQTLKTITGRDITVNENGTFSMELPNNITGVGYYNSSEEKLKADMMGLAGAVRACGYDSITMTVDNKSEEHAMRDGRAAYEAARESGFDVDKITITVNGTDYTGKALREKLFKDKGKEFAAIDASAQYAAAERREAVMQISSVTDPDNPDAGNSNTARYAELRDRLDTARTDAKSMERVPGDDMELGDDEPTNSL